MTRMKYLTDGRVDRTEDMHYVCEGQVSECEHAD